MDPISMLMYNLDEAELELEQIQLYGNADYDEEDIENLKLSIENLKDELFKARMLETGGL